MQEEERKHTGLLEWQENAYKVTKEKTIKY